MAVFLIAVAFSLPGVNTYLGQIPPHVWHNSTTMLLMPFAVALFWTSLSFLRSGESPYLWWSLPLIALNIAAKPSFVLCLFPVLPLAALVRFGWSAPTRRAIALVAAGGAMLAAQSVYIYVVNPGSDAQAGADSSVALAALRV